ncbi:MAG: hypothetical protein HYX60_10490 [Legionella longbeachae]|nr:hypothetical protein [Legionella longbeachae]
MFDKYYEFENYSGKTIKYPVAAYAAIYDDKWVEVPHIYSWLDQQKQPISYKKVIQRFEEVEKNTTAKIPTYDIDFRALIQILAILLPENSVESIKSRYLDLNDVCSNPYGVTIGVKNHTEAQALLKPLNEDGVFISNINKKSYSEKYLLWVICSAKYMPNEKQLSRPELMQIYWQVRAKSPEKINIEKEKKIKTSNNKMEQNTINPELNSKLLNQINFISNFLKQSKKETSSNNNSLKSNEINGKDDHPLTNQVIKKTPSLGDLCLFKIKDNNPNCDEKEKSCSIENK